MGEKLEALIGTVSTLIWLLALVSQFSKSLAEAIGVIGKLPPSDWFTAAVILLSAGIVTLQDGLTRRSRWLKADNPKHLKGCEGDIERLSTLSYEYQQMHLR